MFWTPEGVAYYYHPATGKTVWEKPVEDIEQEMGSGMLSEKEKDGSSAGGMFSGKKMTRVMSGKTDNRVTWIAINSAFYHLPIRLYALEQKK